MKIFLDDENIFGRFKKMWRNWTN